MGFKTFVVCACKITLMTYMNLTYLSCEVYCDVFIISYVM
jgi:hypothetical protein